MSGQSSGEVTELLNDWSHGDEQALAKLMPLVYEELRRTAAGYIRNERPDHTLQPTALVNEAYLRLVRQKQLSWDNRVQFFALSAQMMRRILVDHARKRSYRKRGGGAARMSLDEVGEKAAGEGPDLLDLHAALDALATYSEEHARIVELRQFGGLNQAEVAKFLDISTATVARRWRVAKAWLYRYLHDEDASGQRGPKTAR